MKGAEIDDQQLKIQKKPSVIRDYRSLSIKTLDLQQIKQNEYEVRFASVQSRQKLKMQD